MFNLFKVLFAITVCPLHILGMNFVPPPPSIPLRSLLLEGTHFS